MGRVNTPLIEEKVKIALEKGCASNSSHAFRKRCHLILLKSQGRSSYDVASIVNMCEMSVNNWVARFNKEGLSGLKTKKGRGRKPLLAKEKDSTAVLAAIKMHRQRIKTAKAEFEVGGGQVVSTRTFRRFLKVLAEDIRG